MKWCELQPKQCLANSGILFVNIAFFPPEGYFCFFVFFPYLGRERTQRVPFFIHRVFKKNNNACLCLNAKVLYILAKFCLSLWEASYAKSSSVYHEADHPLRLETCRTVVLKSSECIQTIEGFPSSYKWKQKQHLVQWCQLSTKISKPLPILALRQGILVHYIISRDQKLMSPFTHPRMDCCGLPPPMRKPHQCALAKDLAMIFFVNNAAIF